MSELSKIEKSGPSVFRVIDRLDPEYFSLQGMVSERYLETYNATISPSPDMFALLRDEYRAVAVCGACYGVTSASGKKLFSEYYLDEPVESLIHERFGIRVERKNVSEISSLVSCDAPGAGKKIIAMIPWFIWSLGFEFVLMTATTQLRKLMREAGILYHPISKATVDRLPEKGSKALWGSYYETQPLVGIIDIKATLYKDMLSELKTKFNLNQVDVRYHTDSGHIFSNQTDMRNCYAA